MADETDISKLLRLKRYEQPPPDYFEDFVFEFRRRQRAELLKVSPWQSMWDRVLNFAPTFRVPQFAYGAIAALAVSASVVILTQQTGDSNMLVAESKASIPAISLTSSKPVTIGDTVPVSARSGGPMSSHFVLQPRPVSNEQPLSF